MSTSPATSQEKKVLQPSFHFLSKQIKIGDDYTTDTIPVSELVPASHKLADFPNFPRFAEKGYEKALVIAGIGVQYHDEIDAYLAEYAGYPRVRKLRNDQGQEVTEISIEPLLLVSADSMTATLVLHPPLPEGRTLQGDNLEQTLQDDGVVYGLLEDGLQEVRDWLATGELEFKKVLVARGQDAGVSLDAYLRFELEIGPIAGTIMEDGSIDFRERRIMVGIRAGEVIATKVPAVQGPPGINVYGEESPAKEGRDIKVEVLNDAKFNPETLQVIATKDGVLSVINNNVIKVCSHQVIRADIDFETGNVESHNSISVSGSVQPGFKVNAGGDLEINGGVSSAKLTAQGNIVVKGGITGSNSEIVAGGDVDINFIEQGSITCGGIAVVRKQSYYSNLSVGGDLRCQPHCKIIGGRLIARGSITLGDLGSENSRPSLIAAGIIPERMAEFEKLKASVVEQQDAIVQWLQMYRGSGNSKKVRGMEKDLAETKLKLLRLNLIPGTGLYSKAAGGNEEEALEGEEYSDANAIDIAAITIDVHGTIHADTEIRIGNCKMILDKTVSGRQFKLHPNKKRILAVTLKR